jgi:hypothetical protein
MLFCPRCRFFDQAAQSLVCFRRVSRHLNRVVGESPKLTQNSHLVCFLHLLFKNTFVERSEIRQQYDSKRNPAKLHCVFLEVGLDAAMPTYSGVAAF